MIVPDRMGWEKHVRLNLNYIYGTVYVYVALLLCICDSSLHRNVCTFVRIAKLQNYWAHKLGQPSQTALLEKRVNVSPGIDPGF